MLGGCAPSSACASNRSTMTLKFYGTFSLSRPWTSFDGQRKLSLSLPPFLGTELSHRLASDFSMAPVLKSVAEVSSAGRSERSHPVPVLELRGVLHGPRYPSWTLHEIRTRTLDCPFVTNLASKRNRRRVATCNRNINIKWPSDLGCANGETPMSLSFALPENPERCQNSAQSPNSPCRNSRVMKNIFSQQSSRNERDVR